MTVRNRNNGGVKGPWRSRPAAVVVGDPLVEPQAEALYQSWWSSRVGGDGYTLPAPTGWQNEVRLKAAIEAALEVAVPSVPSAASARFAQQPKRRGSSSV